MIRPLAATTLAALLLTGCGDGNRKDGPARSAEGEILGQSVSDAMLPLDRVRSQAPLAPRSAEPGETKKDAKPAGDAAEKPSEAPAPAAAESPAD
jgi:hypothetical protein